MRAADRRGATLPLAVALLIVASVVAAATFVRERAARRATVHVADLGRILEAAQSAQAEAVADLRERATGATPAAGRVAPSRTRAACAEDAPWLEVGEVEVTPVNAATPAQITAGGAPHGVVEMSVRVRSRRGGARTMRQRRVYFSGSTGRFALVGEPLGTVIE
jgi:Tfp pilus assembly protein PilX